MSLGVVSLRSSSKGNAFLVRIKADKTIVSILLDAGISVQEFKNACGILMIDPWIDHIFVTHHHGDHSGKVFELAKCFKPQVHMSKECWEELQQKRSSAGDSCLFDCDRLRILEPGKSLAFDFFSVQTFLVPHDAMNLGFVVKSEDYSLGYLLDLGHFDAGILKILEGIDFLVIETNHDSSLLAQSSYPSSLAARIAGPWGHLANHQASEILEHLNSEKAASKLKLVIAAHLSSRNNSPALVADSLVRGWYRGKGKAQLPLLHIASPVDPSPIFSLTHRGFVIRKAGNGAKSILSIKTDEVGTAASIGLKG